MKNPCILAAMLLTASSLLFFSCNKKSENAEQLQENNQVENLNDQANPDDPTKEIDQYVKSIEAKLPSLKKTSKEYQNPLQEMHYDNSAFTAFYDGDQLVKLISQDGQAGFSYDLHLYFDKGKLVYFLREGSHLYNRPEDDQLFSIERAYFKDEQVFLVKAKEIETESQVSLNTVAEQVKTLSSKDADWFNSTKKTALDRFAKAE